MAKDPYWSSTKLLLHGDTAGDIFAGSLVLADDFSNASAATLGGTRNLLTASRIASFAGRTDVLDCTTAGTQKRCYWNTGTTALIDGAFTAEFYIYITSYSATDVGALCAGDNSNWGGLGIVFKANGDTQLQIRNVYPTISGYRPPTGQWVHIELSVTSIGYYFFVDGVLKSSGAAASSSSYTTYGWLTLGYSNISTSNSVLAYYDNVRFYKGFTKHDTDFTPPADWLPPYIVPDSSPATFKKQTATGTSLNALYTADSVFGGGCLNFDGLSYLTVAAHSDFNFGTGDYTVEFFIKASQKAYDMVPLDYYMTGVSSWQFILKAAGNITIYEGNPNATSLTGVRFVADNVWHHIALCRKAGILTLFIDGSVDMWIANTKDHNGTPTYLALGAQVSTRNAAYDFTGKLDEVRITKGVARYSMLNITPPTEPVVSSTCDDPYWDNVVLLMHMEGTHNSNTFKDEKGKTLSASGSAVTSTNTSRFGSTAMYTPGTSGLLGTNHVDLQLQAADFTIEAWVNVSGGSGPRTIFGKADGSGGQSYYLYYDVGALVFIYTTDGWSATAQSTVASVTLTIGNWYHVAVSRIGTVIYLFLDGVLVATKTGVPSWFNSAAPFRVGREGISGYEYYWVGYIDELRVTKGVGRYNATFSVPTAAYPQRVDTQTDPYWNSTFFAAPMHGPNGSVDIFDAKGHAPTVYGAAAITTTQGKFLGSSLKFTAGGTDRVTYPHDANFSMSNDLTTNFTFEAWVMLPAIGAQFVVTHKSGGSGVGYPHWTVGIGTNGYVYATCFNASSTVIADSYTPAGTMQAGVWTHIAFVKRGSLIQLFVGGVPATLGSGKFSVAPNDTLAGVLGIGWDLTPGWNSNGYVSDVRITKGIARYVGAFTPEAPAEGQTVVSGVVYDAAGLPCSRTVNVHSRITGRLLGTANSNPVTGVFEIGSPELCYAVVLDSTGAYNSLVLDRLEPLL
jgi:Concanavalin A-like lectin/glucanases superfamily